MKSMRLVGPSLPISFSIILLCVTLASADAGEIYWSAFGSGTFEKVNDDGTDRQLLVSMPSSEIIGPDIDFETELMHWVNNDSGQIQRADLKGKVINNVVHFSPSPTSPDDSVDGLNDKIYWTGISGVRRSNLDGTQVETIVSKSHIPFGIDIDLLKGHVDWANFDGGRIRRASLES